MMKVHENEAYQKLIDEIDDMSALLDDEALFSQKLEALEQLANEKNDTILKAIVTYHKADIPYKYIDFDTCRKYMNESLQLCKEENLTYYLIRCYNTLAIINSEESDFYASTSYYLKALHISNQHPEYAYTCVILNNIENLFVWLNEHESALDYLLQSYDKYYEEKIDSIYTISIIVLNIVEEYSLLNEYEKAKEWASLPIEFYSDAKVFIDIILALNTIDELYQAKRYDEIAPYVEQVVAYNAVDTFIYSFRCLMRLLEIAIRENDSKVAKHAYERLEPLANDSRIRTFKYDYSVLRNKYYYAFEEANDDGTLAKKLLKAYTKDSSSVVAQFRNTYSRRLIMESEILKINAEKESAISKNLQLQKDIELDYFTQILNKVSIEKYIETELQNRDALSNQAMLLIDIDYFKQVNDTYGHERGDELILSVVEMISSSISKNMLFGRFGGDEFILFIKNAKQIEFFEFFAKELLERARNIIIEADKHITLSIGVGVVSNSKSDFKEVFALADKALYIAKEIGRDTYAICD